MIKFKSLFFVSLFCMISGNLTFAMSGSSCCGHKEVNEKEISPHDNPSATKEVKYSEMKIQKEKDIAHAKEQEKTMVVSGKAAFTFELPQADLNEAILDTVIFVDDQPVNAMGLWGVLKGNKIARQLIYYSSGLDFLKGLTKNRTDHNPEKEDLVANADVIFMDHDMPKMNGPEVIEKFLLLKITKPVIIGYSTDSENNKAMKRAGSQYSVCKKVGDDGILLLARKISSEAEAKVLVNAEGTRPELNIYQLENSTGSHHERVLDSLNQRMSLILDGNPVIPSQELHDDSIELLN